MNPTAGRHEVSKACIVHQGKKIELDALEMELSSTQAGELDVFASASMTAKIPGLSPEEEDIQVWLEWEGKFYEIARAAVFDVEVDLSGTTTVQVTGRLKPALKEAWDDF